MCTHTWVHIAHSIRINKNIKFHKAGISKLCMKNIIEKKHCWVQFITKQNIIAKISQKESSFFTMYIKSQQYLNI